MEQTINFFSCCGEETEEISNDCKVPARISPQKHSKQSVSRRNRKDVSASGSPNNANNLSAFQIFSELI